MDWMPILLLEQQCQTTERQQIADFKEPDKGMVIHKDHYKKPLTVNVPVDVGAYTWNNP